MKANPSPESSERLSRALAILDQSWRPSEKEISGQKEIPIYLRLHREGIENFEELIHLQPGDWLKKTFGPGTDYPVHISKLIKNIIWQIRNRILEKNQPSNEGLIRSFWYQFIKPALARTDSLNQKVDQYAQMIKAFVRLIQVCDLIRYKDFGFTDDNQNDRKIGINNHIILFAEKAGHFPLLQRIAKETDVTVLSLGGQPSLLSAEYFVNEIKASGINIQKTFYTFSLVDYDPSGWIIRDAFLDDLRFYGLKHLQNQDLILPGIFSQEEIDLNKFPLPAPPEMKVKNQEWLKKSGGIDGKLFGLEVDAAPVQQIENLFKSLIRDLIESTEEFRKSKALFEVSSSLDEYILARVKYSEKREVCYA